MVNAIPRLREVIGQCLCKIIDLATKVANPKIKLLLENKKNKKLN